MKLKNILSLLFGFYCLISYADGLMGDSTVANALLNAQAGAQSAQAGAITDTPNIAVPPIQALGMGAGGNNLSNTISNTLAVSANSSSTASIPMRPRPPLLPNAFQQSVQVRTGLLMKQYGYDLFNLPNTYNLINNVPIDNNYTLGPGDQIFIQGWGSLNISYTAEITSDGTIYIPKIGSFNIAGVKAGSLESFLKNKIGSVYKKFQLSATVSKIRSIQVNVTGYAQVPGTYTVSSLTNLSNAIFAAGGPAADGSLRHIELRRNGQLVKDFDMYQVLLKGNNFSDERLLPGDIIYFPPKGLEVAIYDGVKFPAVYEAIKGETVADILKYAGGATFDNSKNKVVIEQISNNKLVVNDYPYKAGLNELISNGDIVHFSRMNKQYDRTIVLMGNIANPTRLSFRPGMTIRDIIPRKEALLTRSFWDSYSYNTYGKDYLITETGLEKSTHRFASDNPSYNSSTGLNSSSGQDNSMADQAGNLLADQRFNATSSGAGSQDAKAIFSNRDNLLVAGPINIPEADINWNYAAIIRIDPRDYSSHIIPFDLARAIAGDAQNNLKLQAGDVIDILSSKDVRNPTEYHPTFAFIDGEVRKPGVYELQTGESLVALINRAGGITQKAYIFGMEIDRLSVKKKQQLILNQMLDQAQQSLLAQAGSAGLSATNVSQVQIQAQLMQSQQAMLEKMRKIQPVGRVVLRIKSNRAGVNDLQNFAIENGDTVYIPPRPNTIDVIGQVYNPATFDYESSLSISDYINQAGTENDFADKSNEYVLQANGIIYSRNQAGWYGGFGSRSMNPGDSIIVPQLVQFGSMLQNLTNWTQIIANSAQAVALFNR